MPDFFTDLFYGFIIASILVFASVLIQWLRYRKSKNDEIKHADIDYIITDSMKPAVAKTNHLDTISAKGPVIKLPEVYSPKEMQFIDNWYMEAGISQFKQAQGREFVLLKDKPPVPGCKYVNVEGVMVNLKKRDNKTLKLIDIQLPKTVKLLMLDAWIK